MANRLIISGKIASLPELQQTGSGLAMLRFTLQSTERKTYKGQTTESVSVYELAAFGEKAISLEGTLRVGQTVICEGRLSSRDKEVNGNVFHNLSIIVNDVEIVASAYENNVFSVESQDIPF